MTTATLAPPSTDTDALTEVVDGVTVEKDVSIGSQWIASRLDQRLGPFVDDNRLGIVVIEGVFILAPDDQLKRRPDVAFVSTERWPFDQNPPLEGDWELAPDLAVEVVSPTNSAEDLIAKVHEYFAHGVREVWLIYPAARAVYVYEGSPDAVRGLRVPGVLETKLVPGWQLSLATLFRTNAS